MDYAMNDTVYRPMVVDGMLNTFVSSPNAYSSAVEAVIEAMHFAEVYNEDMYDGKISWSDSELTRGTRDYLRILTGTIDRPNANPFYIEIQKLQDNGKIRVVNKSRAKDIVREQHNETASNLAMKIENRFNEL
ncbi:hypothetical protein [Pontibacillus sp. HMF3514]|uniref:hypothetical protein n=1 Tax=Pontibacillus sp. HMF3514 TaxID=2692425 RepID=UPI0013201405|nr:hypothetical protein [Pontibacillus sp. HMF3514]QHE52424.1 hypothetical protein GS400_10420 [Pontibacillus sp. HMF3514]